MLVILSDLHITDSSTSVNVDASAFTGILGPSIAESMAQKSATELHIVLLGDIFDVVRTNHWVKNVPSDQRPWNGTLDPLTAMNTSTEAIKQQFCIVLGNILNSPSAQGLLEMLRKLSLDANGKSIRVTYVIGNHDRVLNNFVELQNQIKAAFPPSINLLFDTKVEEPRYGVLARHGHEWETECHSFKFWTDVMQKDAPITRFDPRVYRMMAIGEVITAELMGGFIFKTEDIFARNGRNSADDANFLAGLRDVNSLRPMTSMFTWLRWYSRNKDAKYQDALREALLFALDNLLGSKLAERWDEISKPIFRRDLFGDITDHLQAVRDELDSGGLARVEKTMNRLLEVESLKEFFFRDKKEDDLLKGAAEEFKDPALDKSIQYIVYGHTHEARHDFLQGTADGRVSMYINTGTYLPFIQLCRDEKGFANAHFITMAFFYKEDEDIAGRKDKGPTLELWDGVRRKVYK